ncbi:unnamed protein product [Cylindrotheca closterium]|uniref:Uncharacterized protein n=1 Tax=Cylindrotheca closterium TaxID=2856 RepID=A0AAD2CGC8_9STRA|nr:unnamed protein product [Cylindrotheca closterium]
MFWWLIDFARHPSGKWRFKRIDEVATDFDLLVVDPEGKTVVLSRLQLDKCEQNLGVQMSPKLNPKAQHDVLVASAKSWANQIASGHLLPYDVFPLLKTTILKTLGYPMALTRLSTAQWGKDLCPRSVGFPSQGQGLSQLSLGPGVWSHGVPGPLYQSSCGSPIDQPTGDAALSPG